MVKWGSIRTLSWIFLNITFTWSQFWKMAAISFQQNIVRVVHLEVVQGGPLNTLIPNMCLQQPMSGESGLPPRYDRVWEQTNRWIREEEQVAWIEVWQHGERNEWASGKSLQEANMNKGERFSEKDFHVEITFGSWASRKIKIPEFKRIASPSWKKLYAINSGWKRRWREPTVTAPSTTIGRVTSLWRPSPTGIKRRWWKLRGRCFSMLAFSSLMT